MKGLTDRSLTAMRAVLDGLDADVVVLIVRVRPSIALVDPDRDVAIDAMRIAAEKRTEGILGDRWHDV